MDMSPLPPSRRDLLKAAGLAPIVFGFAALGCRGDTSPPESNGRAPRGKPWTPKDGPPAGWIEALTAARDGGKPCVALRIPAEPRVAKALGSTLVDLCARGTLDQRLLFVEAVFVCLTNAQVAALIGGAGASDDAMLFEAQGTLAKRIDGAAVPEAHARDRGRLGAALRALVEGANGERLAARAVERRRGATKEQLALLDPLPLGGDGGLAYEFPGSLIPVLLDERRTTSDPARRGRIDAALGKPLDARLRWGGIVADRPYGVDYASEGGGCGGGDSNIACGMAMPIPSSYRFLGFLTTPG